MRPWTTSQRRARRSRAHRGASTISCLTALYPTQGTAGRMCRLPCRLLVCTPQGTQETNPPLLLLSQGPTPAACCWLFLPYPGIATIPARGKVLPDEEVAIVAAAPPKDLVARVRGHVFQCNQQPALQCKQCCVLWCVFATACMFAIAGKWVQVSPSFCDFVNVLINYVSPSKQRTDFVLALPKASDMETLARYSAKGLLRANIEARIPFDRAPEALERCKEGHISGKVVVVMDD